MNNRAVSIVVPTLNEEENLPDLVKRIDNTLTPANISYEVVIIDDHSTDNTFEVAKELQSKYPVMTYEKRGTRGKAYSLLEGFDKCRYNTVAMIDADLQYPPEALSDMHELLSDTGADVVVTRRHDSKSSPIRKLSSYTFNLIFSKWLFGIDFDTQSGLKMFKKRVLNHFRMNPSPWSFDQEFIVRSLEHRFKILSHTIPFSERNAGATKVKLLSVTYELAKASLILRWHTSVDKMKEGSRANNRFLKRTLPLTAVSLFAAAALMLSPTMVSAAERSSNDNRSSNTRQSNGNWLSFLFGPQRTSNSNQRQETTQSTKNQTSSRSSSNQTVSQQPNPQAAQAPLPSSTQPAPTPAPATTPQPTKPSPTFQQRPTATVASAAPAQASTPTPSAPTTDVSKLAPATNANTTKDLYASGYPNYTLSNQSTDRLRNGAKTALLIGGGLLIAAIAAGIYTRVRLRSPQPAFVKS